MYTFWIQGLKCWNNTSIGLVHYTWRLSSVIIITNNIAIVIMTPIFEVPHVVQFYYIIVLIVISPFLRFYREASTELHRPKEVTQFEEI